MNVVDVIIIALLRLGGVDGFKAGVIKKLTDFIVMFVVIIFFERCAHDYWFM